MVDKLKLQLLRRVRAEFGTSGEQLDAQINLIDITAALAQPVAGAPAKTAPANAPEIDRSLPAHLPRQAQVHRPVATAAHHDTTGQRCGCTACGGRLRQIGQDALRATRVRALALQGDPPCAAQAGVRDLPVDLPGRSAEPTDPARCCRTRADRPCDGLQILRPYPPVPPERHLRPRRRGDRPLHHGRLGRPGRSTAGPSGSRARALHAGCGQGARRRHAGARAQPRPGQDQDWPTVGVRAR